MRELFYTLRLVDEGCPRYRPEMQSGLGGPVARFGEVIGSERSRDWRFRDSSKNATARSGARAGSESALAAGVVES